VVEVRVTCERRNCALQATVDIFKIFTGLFVILFSVSQTLTGVDWFQTPRGQLPVSGNIPNVIQRHTPRGQLPVSGNIFEVVRLTSRGHLPACLLKHT
jgi:hypothetical protein